MSRHFDTLEHAIRERGGDYNAIYVDVPWKYSFARTVANGGMKYATLSLPQLKAMGPSIQQLANPHSCLLFFWATGPKLAEAFEVIKSWGFQYATIGFTWIKTRRHNTLHSGLGRYTKSNCEVCLIARRGRCPEIVDKTVKQVVMAPLREHSQKPDIVRKYIVDLLGDVPRIELFARFVPRNDASGRTASQHTQGWDTFGDRNFGDGDNDLSPRSPNAHRLPSLSDGDWSSDAEEEHPAPRRPRHARRFLPRSW